MNHQASEKPPDEIVCMEDKVTQKARVNKRASSTQ